MVGSTAVGTSIWLIARSGSLSPFPVRTQTTVEPSATPTLRRPATEAADAGSQNTDSFVAKKRYAARISSSVTMSIAPSDSAAAAAAGTQLAGLPIRIAVAIVSGCSTG